MSRHKFQHSSFPMGSDRHLGNNEFNQESTDPTSISTNPQPYPCSTSHGESPIFKYINDILMEEDMADRPCMMQDSLALQATEKSFYDVLGMNDPFSSDQYDFLSRNYPIPSDHYDVFGQNYPLSSDQSDALGNNYPLCSNQYDALGENDPLSYDQFPPCFDQNLESQPNNFNTTCCVDSSNSCNIGTNLPESCPVSNQVELEPFLPQISHSFPSQSIISVPNLQQEPQNFLQFNAMVESSSEQLGRGRKIHPREDNGYAEEGIRSSKHTEVCTEESEQFEMLYNAFLHNIDNQESRLDPLYDPSRNEASKKFQQNEQLQAFASRIRRSRRNKSESEKADLWTLLTQCAEAVAKGDQSAAYELLQEIRKHSSPYGNGNQRLAHYFANGLEARIRGSGLLFCSQTRPTASDIIKAYKLYVSICPFRKMTNRFANMTIVKAAEEATRLHVIDIGISYGLQWPCLMRALSIRPSGPLRIRITGIDLPQSGFRPAERVEVTGRRLKRMAEKMNISLQYTAIAQKWETIKLEDLKIDRDEVIAVNCMYRMRNLPDDTTVLNSSRDAVLKLIKKINPNVFVLGVINGSFNAPFFVTRFRQALFHYSALFDMFDANTAREDQERLVFERDNIGREAMNVIACEGIERIERPEMYKQWHSRNSRIGFRQLPLDKKVMGLVRDLEPDYHKDFLLDMDGHWILLGWKGRIIQAMSAWKPVHE